MGRIAKMKRQMIMEANKRLLSEQTEMDILNQACEVWGNLSDEEKGRFLEYSKTKTGTDYPYDPEVACSEGREDTPLSDKDQELLNDLINSNY